MDDKNKNEELRDQENTDQVNDEPEKKPEVKYTDKDLDEIIGKKFKAWKEKEEKAVKEAERLAKMSAAEREAEAIKRAEEAEAKLTRFGLKTEARGILSEANISVSENLLDVLVGSDAETTKNNLDDFAKMFNDAVEAEVKKRIAGNTPKAGNGKNPTKTKEEIMAIKDPQLRRKAIAENMALFE